MMSRTVRQVLDITLCAAKSLQSFGSISWKYLKVEALPPMTAGFFNGVGGRKLENFAAKITNGLINTIDGTIKEIDAEAERTRRAIIAAAEAHERKLKAEAKAKEAARIKEIAEKAAEAVKKAKALAEKKQAEEAAKKPKEDPKAKAKAKGERRRKPKQRAKKKPPKESK